jgi:hypothetical protein
VLRKLTGCLSSTTCNNDESPKQEHIPSTTNTLSCLSSIEDITIKTTISNKVNSPIESRDIKQTIDMDEK